jgi:hypothetical protein
MFQNSSNEREKKVSFCFICILVFFIHACLRMSLSHSQSKTVQQQQQQQQLNNLQITTTVAQVDAQPLRYSHMSRCSSGSIVSDYGLDDRAIGVRSPAGAKDFSSSLCVQTGSETHPASYPMGTGGPFPGAKHSRGLTLTNHPIKCRIQKLVGAISAFTLSFA